MKKYGGEGRTHVKLEVYDKHGQTFPMKDQIVNILGLMRCEVSIGNIQQPQIIM